MILDDPKLEQECQVIFMKYNQVFEHRLKNQIIKLGRAVINVVVFATVN